MVVESPARRSDRLNVRCASHGDRLSRLTLDKQIFDVLHPLLARLARAWPFPPISSCNSANFLALPIFNHGHPFMTVVAADLSYCLTASSAEKGLWIFTRVHISDILSDFHLL